MSYELLHPFTFFIISLMTNKFSLPAFAKINLFLEILGKRDDGFHEISTCFQTVSLHDTLTFEENDELVLSCVDKNIPVDERNLIIKAAAELQKKFGITRGAKIHLEKRIPSPAGLGGGSSDGAIALLGLAKLWNLQIKRTELLEIGKNLGSDVPFFFDGGTALGIGRGTEITSFKDFNEKFMLIVKPPVEVSTGIAFAKLNAPHLTKVSSKRILKLCSDTTEKLFSRQITPKNDFEKVIFEIEPEIQRVKEKLLENGAVTALMTGSGASVFGIFENEETRQATLKALVNELNWRMFAVATISRQCYREALKDVLKVVSD